MAHKHIFGKSVAASAGFTPIDEKMVIKMAADMKLMMADPNSQVSKYTRECRANGIPCLQDQLDAGKSMEDAVRESVFVKH